MTQGEFGIQGLSAYHEMMNSQARPLGRMAVAVGVGVGLIYLAFLPPGIYSIDSNSMVGVAESLVTQGQVTVSPATGIVGRDGLYFSAWYPLLSILAVPFVALGYLLSGIVGLPAHYVAIVSALVLVSVLTATTSGLVVCLTLRLGGTPLHACLAGVGFAFGTIAMTYARTFFADPLLALLTTASLYFALGEGRKDVAAVAILSALAVLAKPTGLVVGPVLAGYLIAKRRDTVTSLLPLAGSVVGAALYAFYNYYRFGDPFTFGQPWAFSMSAFQEGLVGLVLSPGGGLLWYCPPVMLAAVGFKHVLEARRAEAVTVGLLCAGYLIVYSVWQAWYGGWSWGPRLLLPAIPLLVTFSALSGARWTRVLVLLAALGFLVNAPTLVSFYERYYVEAVEQALPPSAVYWTVANSPLMHGWETAYGQIQDAFQCDPVRLVREAGNPEANGRLLRVVAVWWWMLPVVHVPWVAGAAAALGIVAMGTAAICKALSIARSALGNGS